MKNKETTKVKKEENVDGKHPMFQVGQEVSATNNKCVVIGVGPDDDYGDGVLITIPSLPSSYRLRKKYKK